jgi:hypothetical protein
MSRSAPSWLALTPGEVYTCTSGRLMAILRASWPSITPGGPRKAGWRGA